MTPKFKKAFTIVEVSILFVIFLIVAFLVVPLSLDDTVQIKSESKWRKVQPEFENIAYAIDTQREMEDYNFVNAFIKSMADQTKKSIRPYRISYKNGANPADIYKFSEYMLTNNDSVMSYKIFPEQKDGVLGILMYDINGQIGPNTWGKDVYGYEIYDSHFEPFCKTKSVTIQKSDCKQGTGLCCSNLTLQGGIAD